MKILASAELARPSHALKSLEGKAKIVERIRLGQYKAEVVVRLVACIL